MYSATRTVSGLFRMGIREASNAQAEIIRLRSCLFLKPPFTAERTLSVKNSDALILDLEDSVPDSEKTPGPNARRNVIRAALNDGIFNDTRVIVRVNSLEEEQFLRHDLNAIGHSRVWAWLLPMLKNANCVRTFDELALQVERANNLPAGSIKFVSLIERTEGLNNCKDIAFASKRQHGLLFGHGDFLADTTGNRNAEVLLAPRSQVVSAARAAGIEPLDTPFLKISDLDLFWKECQHVRDLGYSGKCLIHPSQIGPANTVFSSSPAQIRWAEKIIKATGNGDHIGVVDGFMVGPPHVKRAMRTLGNLAPPTAACKTPLVPKRRRYGLDIKRVSFGKEYTSPFQVTLDSSFITMWQALCLSYTSPYSSAEVARSLGFANTIAPYSLMLNLALCTAVEDVSEACLVHIALTNGVYERAVLPGDTLTVKTKIHNVRNTPSGKRVLVDTIHQVFNQRGERVFRVTKASLFDATGYVAPAVLPEVESDHPPPSQLKSALLKAHVAKPDWATPSLQGAPCVAGEVYLHEFARPIGWSESLLMTTLTRNTHPLHINTMRYPEADITIVGPFVQALALAASERDLRPVLYEELLHSSHVNRTGPNDNISSMSHVISSKPIAGAPGLQELLVKTLGVKNMDIMELEGRNLPSELFSEEPFTREQCEDLCERHSTLLSGKVVVQVLRKIVRPMSGPR